MEKCLLDLPNELLEIITFYVIGSPWKNDVLDFLSFTSSCRALRRFAHDERYWQKMALRRDPLCEDVSETIKWSEYCKEIYLQRTIPGDQLKERISRYNESYFCTIEKVLMWPSKIRVYIHERGDNSLGNIQDPVHSVIALVQKHFRAFHRPIGIRPDHSQFLIADERSEYLGYLEFPYVISLDSIGQNLIFQYGKSGYASAVLVQVDRTFINKYNLIPLFRKLKKIRKPGVLFRAKSI